MRYNSDGSLDSSFSGDGFVTTDFGTDGDYGFSIALQPDGKILFAGGCGGTNYNYIALARYDSKGNLDPSFGNGGKLTTALSSSISVGMSVALQPDGKILVAGETWDGSHDDDYNALGKQFGLVRYNRDGSLDTSFSDDGFVTTTIGLSAEVYSVTLQPDGKILVAGSSWNGTNNDFALVRYNRDGSLDTSFSDDGIVTASIGDLNDGLYDVTLQSDGKILVTGSSSVISIIGARPPTPESYLTLLRYNSDGSLDTTFGAANPINGNNVLIGGQGNHLLDGGGGIDVVKYGGRFVDYGLVKSGNTWTITGSGNLICSDSLINVERLQFADKTIALDLSETGHAGQAMEFIGAVAPSLLNNASVRGTIISLFDQGQTMASLSQLALDLKLLPTASHAELANTVYRNVLGVEATQEMTDGLVAYIDAHGQADFLATVASLHLNVDLVGLQQVGVEYVI